MKTTEQIIDQRVAEFKAQLLKELTPKVEPNYKDGDYILTRGGVKGRLVFIDSEPRLQWSDYLNTNTYNVASISNIARHLTESEIKEALIKEAEKRGFKEGVNLNREMFKNSKSYHIDYGSIKLTGKNDPFYSEKDDVLMMFGFGVYEKGVWANVIKKEESIKIGGYEVKIYGIGETKIDGNYFSKEFWQAAKLISEHSKAKIMIGCSKQFDVSLETINAILEKLK